MNLERKFEKLRKSIEPTQAQKTNIQSLHQRLRNDILQKKEYVQNTLLTGSYKKQTLIRPLGDIDIFVILKESYSIFGQMMSPQTYLNKLKKDLSDEYPNSHIRQDKPCISIDFDFCTFELTPAIFCESWLGNSYLIPDQGNINNWKEVDDPSELASQLSKLNVRYSKLIPLIKIMKHIKRRNNFQFPESYEIEKRAIEIFSLDSLVSYRYGVETLLVDFGWINFWNSVPLMFNSDEQFASFCREKLLGSEFPHP